MGLRVLLVDSNEQRRSLADKALEASRYTITHCRESSHVALQTILTIKPDILVVDWEQGWPEIWKDIAELSLTYPLPIVVFAATNDNMVIKTALHAGVTSFVSDGIHPERLVSVLDVAIARFKETQSLKDELAKTKATLEERKIIERAKGILMQQRGLSEETAYQALRKMAMDENAKIGDIAKQVISIAKLLI